MKLSCCNAGSGDWRPLNRRQRIARAIVGAGLLGLAGELPWSGAGWLVLAAALAWIGASHVLAAAMAYPGCPELGAVPSLARGRWVRIGCGPWRWLDGRLGLDAE